MDKKIQKMIADLENEEREEMILNGLSKAEDWKQQKRRKEEEKKKKQRKKRKS